MSSEKLAGRLEKMAWSWPIFAPHGKEKPTRQSFCHLHPDHVGIDLEHQFMVAGNGQGILEVQHVRRGCHVCLGDA